MTLDEPTPDPDAERHRYHFGGLFLRELFLLLRPGSPGRQSIWAELMEVNEGTVSRWLSGRQRMNDDNLGMLFSMLSDGPAADRAGSDPDALRASLIFLYDHAEQLPDATGVGEMPAPARRFLTGLTGAEHPEDAEIGTAQAATGDTGSLVSPSLGPGLETGDLTALGSITISWEARPEAISPVIGWEETSDIVMDGEPSLLDALTWKYRLTPFQGRDAALGTVLDWARGRGTEVSARLVSGPGGAGKTRLAAEAIETLRAEGWTAGFLPREATSGKVIEGGGTGVFLAIDYPEERPEVVDELIRAIVDYPTGPKPIRLLLLSRREFESWRSAASTLGARFGRQELVAPGPLAAADAEAVLRAAAAGLARLLGVDAPSLEGAAEWLGRSEMHRLPLFAAAAGLHALVAPGAALDLGGAELMRDLAERERIRVERISKRMGLGDHGLARLLALATTSAHGLGTAELRVLHAMALAPDGVSAQALEDAVRASPWWRRPEPVAARRLVRLEPDRPAAAFVAQVLLDDPPARLADWLGPPAEASGADYGRTLSRLAFDLAALSGAWSRDLETAAIAMLDADPSRAQLFRRIGFEDGTAFSAGFAARVLEHLLPQATRDEDRAPLLGSLGNRLDALGRREDALAATQEAAALYRRLAEARPDAFTPDLASALNNLGTMLDALGRREDALAATQEAAALYRRLAEARPDAFTPDLATALNNLGIRLHALGRREDALAATQEAVALRRRLAEARPDAFTPDLAASLNNLGTMLDALGRREDALAATQEAAALYRRLAEARPDAFTPDLATALNNLGIRLDALGRREDALAATQEAAALYRRLAEARPDAFTPDLAMALNNLGNMLHALGRREDALAATQEAAALYRRLAEARPDAFTPDLATALNNLGTRLDALGRREDALAATQEAVALRRRLAEARPDAFTPDLATALNNLGIRLHTLGRREDALAATQEAVALRRRLAEARPDAFTPDLASALNNLGTMLDALGRREDALAATQEAVALRRRLAEARPDAFTPDLAASLNNLGNRLHALGRREDALAATQEAVALRRRLAEARPDAFTPDLASALNNLGTMLDALGRREDALAATQEAVALRRRLAEARPDAFTPDLAASLNNLGNRLHALGRREDALAATQEAVALRRRLAEARPDAFTPDLASALNNLGNRLHALGRREDALAATQEALRLFAPHFLARPAAHAAWMQSMLQGYRDRSRDAGLTPDPELTDPILEALRALRRPEN